MAEGAANAYTWRGDKVIWNKVTKVENLSQIRVIDVPDAVELTQVSGA